MISPRLTKVFKDLGTNKTRTILVILSIAVGVFAVGLVMNGYLVLLNDMNVDYNSANPHAAVVYTDPFSDDQVAVIRHMPAVGYAEGRASTGARTKNTKGDWMQIQFTVIPALDKMVLDKIRPSNPGDKLVLGDKEVFIDRASMSPLPVKVGDLLEVELPNKQVKRLKVAGIVHDVSAISTLFSSTASAYVNQTTLEWLGGSDQFNQLYLTVADDKLSEEHVKAVTTTVTDKLNRAGIKTYATVIFKPGENPVYSITQSLLAMMGFLGALATFLSAFLIVNTINALMSQHVRQIGVMKAVGGKTGQILVMYIGLVLAFGVIALLIAVPLAGYLNYVLVGALSAILNFQPGPFRIPLPSLVVQGIVALGVPLMASLGPVTSGTRLTIREAISNYGLSGTVFGQSWLDRLLERVRELPRPLLLSLRNTFRRKGRLILTLSTLTLGGAIFIGVFNLKASFDLTINQVLGYFLSDVNLQLNDAYRLEKVEGIIYSVPGVKTVENWGTQSARVLSPDKATSTEVLVWGPPAGSKLIKPSMTAGRWLVPGDENAVVVGNHFLKQRPDVKVGDELVFKINEKESTWKVVGIYLMAGNVIPPFVYVNNEYLTQVTGIVDRGFNFRIVTDNSSAALQTRVAKELEPKLVAAGIKVGSITTGVDEQTRQAASINILVYTLLVMALLVAFVGGIGLMGTMTMNVMERTREIGVMRSIGASNFAILSMVVVEGMIIGGISWLLGSLLSIPISKLLGDVVGTSFVQVPLTFVFSINGPLVWLALISVLSTIACILPALNAVRLTIRDILAYE